MFWNRIRQRGTGNLILAGILGGLVLVVAAPAVVGPGPRDGTLAAGQWPAGHASPHIVDAAFTMGDASIHINVDPNRTSGTDLDLEMIWAEAAEVGTLHFRHGDVLSGRIVAEHIYMEDGATVYYEPGTEIIAAGDLYLGAVLVPARPPNGGGALAGNGDGDPDPLGPPCVPAEIEFDEDKDGNPTHPTNLPNVNWGDDDVPIWATPTEQNAPAGADFPRMNGNQITVTMAATSAFCTSNGGSPGEDLQADGQPFNKDAIAIGGHGGHGGSMNIQGMPGKKGEESTVTFEKGAAICNTGGGVGGHATAHGSLGRDCMPGGSAVALAGNGGNAGNVTVKADNIVLFTTPPGERFPLVTAIDIAQAGRGGPATAVGGKGGDCGDCQEDSAGRGGDAFAQGGNAGDGAAVTLEAKRFTMSGDGGEASQGDLTEWLRHRVHSANFPGVSHPHTEGGTGRATSGEGGNATMACPCSVAGIAGGDAGRACGMGGVGGSGHTVTIVRAENSPSGDQGVLASRASSGGVGGFGKALSNGGGHGGNSLNCACNQFGAGAGGKGGDGALAEGRGGKGGDANLPPTLGNNQGVIGSAVTFSGNGGAAETACGPGGNGGNGGTCTPDAQPINCFPGAAGAFGTKGAMITVGGDPGDVVGKAQEGQKGGENPSGNCLDGIPGNQGGDDCTTFGDPCRYSYDSGATTTAVGIPEPAVLMWLQKFEAFDGFDLVLAIQSTFGSPTLPGIVGVSPGDPVGYVIYDVGPDGGPGNLLFQGFAAADADAIATDDPQVFEVPEVPVAGEFFVGVYVADPGEGFFPAPLDQSVAEPAENVWVAAHAVDIDTFDPGSDSAEWSLPPATLITFDIPGVWRLCATGVQDKAPPESCAGSCGGTAAAGCWCDQACVDLGDCCEDHCEQCPGTCCPWDVTSDGVVGPADLLECIGQVGPCPQDGPCPCDFNRDGAVNDLDLKILLEHFDDCP